MTSKNPAVSPKIPCSPAFSSFPRSFLSNCFCQCQTGHHYMWIYTCLKPQQCNARVARLILGIQQWEVVHCACDGITHGRTLTTEISFKDVVKTIWEFAFVANPSPAMAWMVPTAPLLRKSHLVPVQSISLQFQ